MNGVYITFRQTTISTFVSVWIQKMLGSEGIECKTGFDRLRIGRFPEALIQTIEKCADVIVIITPDTWGRSDDENCWMAKEIELAILLEKNIIPVVIDDHAWYKKLPRNIKQLACFQALICHSDYLEASLNRLQDCLRTKPKNNQLSNVKPYMGEKDFIFISYSHKNSNAVMEIIERLQKDGYRIWYDEGIDPGTEWDDYIAEKIEKSGYLIAFISNEYLESENCRDELNYARDLDKNRLLVYLTDVRLTGGMAMRLNRLQAIHKYAYPSLDDFMNKLEGTSALERFKE